MRLFDDFEHLIPNPPLQPLLIGNGYLNWDGRSTIYCTVGPTDGQSYHDAQIMDYGGLKRHQYAWRPPLRLTVRAWASHAADQLRGTAGFGFWNQPLMPTQPWPRIPRAIWFFLGAPPNDMALAKGVPGYGWKAATFDAMTARFLMLAPLAPLGFALMNVPQLYRRLWPIGQRAIGVSEALLPTDIREPHTYELLWLPHSAQFFVDGERVHEAPCSPKGPLGFVAWIDNQYAIVTPQGRLGYGYLPVATEQWLALDSISIE